MTTLDWTTAAAEAESVTRGWAGTGDAIPGGVVLLFDRDGVRAEAASGLVCLAHDIPFTATTPARCAAITKLVFCAFALRQGFDLQARLGTLPTDLSAPLASVPVWRALSMTGGILDLMQSYVLCGVPHTATLDGAALDAFTRSLPGLDTVPGTEVSYSNTGCRLVEQALALCGANFSTWVGGTPSSPTPQAPPCSTR